MQNYPKLWAGAWSPRERYMQADIAAIVEYARARGVRVMVEFDMPGHAAAWCKGYPEVCPSAACTQPLDVSKNATFELITGLLTEMTGGKPSAPGKPSGLFPDDFVHLGGDEARSIEHAPPSARHPGRRHPDGATHGHARSPRALRWRR
jgi:hexosaminidase